MRAAPAEPNPGFRAQPHLMNLGPAASGTSLFCVGRKEGNEKKRVLGEGAWEQPPAPGTKSVPCGGFSRVLGRHRALVEAAGLRGEDETPTGRGAFVATRSTVWPQPGPLKEAQHQFGYSRGVGPKAAPHRGHGRGGMALGVFHHQHMAPGSSSERTVSGPR